MKEKGNKKHIDNLIELQSQQNNHKLVYLFDFHLNFSNRVNNVEQTRDGQNKMQGK